MDENNAAFSRGADILRSINPDDQFDEDMRVTMVPLSGKKLRQLFVLFKYLM